MSAISIVLLVAAAVATALGGAALHTVRGLHRELTALRDQLDTAEAARAAAAAPVSVPAARQSPAEEIRAAVSAALAEERERELAEARAFWAAQEARDADTDTGLLAGHGTEYEVAPDLDGALLDALLEGRLDDLDVPDGPLGGDVFVPRQSGTAGSDTAGAPDAFDTSEYVEALDPPEFGDDPDAGDRAEYGDRVESDGPTEVAGIAEVSEAAGTGGTTEATETVEPVEARETAEIPEHADTRTADTRTAGSRAADAGPDLGPESPELAAARRRHPSHPGFHLYGDPVVPSPTPPGGHGPVLAEHERTVRRLTELAEARTPLADVRPGPLGTLDVYAFEDGTTLCMSPGHQETARHLAQALDGGLPPVLLGGSGVSGAYALTFAIGDETVYTLADRVIASL
ncbi:hypothetical protein [Streptomyces sp. NPDC054784]